MNKTRLGAFGNSYYASSSDEDKPPPPELKQFSNPKEKVIAKETVQTKDESLPKEIEQIDESAFHKRATASFPEMTHSVSCRVIPLDELGGVSCIEVTPNGKRLVIGSSKGKIFVYHFANMYEDVSVSEEWADYEGRAVKFIKYDEFGKQMAVGIGEPYVTIKDNDNAVVWETYRGDMYVRDTANTFGHVHPVTQVMWFDEFTLLCSSDDCTVRVFDSRSAPRGLDQRIPSSCVFKTLDKDNRPISNDSRVSSFAFVEATAALPKPLTNKPLLVGACSDGSLQVWEAQWPPGVKSKKPLKIIRGSITTENSVAMKVLSWSDRYLYVRTPSSIVRYDLLRDEVECSAYVSAARLYDPLICFYRPQHSDEMYVVTVNEKSTICWYSSRLRHIKDITPLFSDESEVLTCLYVSCHNQLLAGSSKGMMYAFWAAEDQNHKRSSEEGDPQQRGATLIKPARGIAVESGFAPDMQSSYSIYELPDNYKLYEDDVIKE